MLAVASLVLNDISGSRCGFDGRRNSLNLHPLHTAGIELMSREFRLRQRLIAIFLRKQFGIVVWHLDRESFEHAVSEGEKVASL